MADVTYPSGVNSWATISPAGTTIPTSETTMGSVQLGDGKPVDGNKAALGVVFQFAITAGSATGLTLTFECTNDGTTWYEMDEYDFAIASNLADTDFRLHLQPFTHGAIAVRVKATAATATATGRISARLTDIFGVLAS